MGGRPSGLPAELLAQLGTKPDPQLAKDFGRKTDTVAKARMARGIPAFNHQQKWTLEQVALLGTMTDREVAKRVGRNQAAVTFARNARGIPGCDHLGQPRPEAQRKPTKPTAQEVGASIHLVADWRAIELIYRTKRYPLSWLAHKFHVPTFAIRHWAETHQWVRCAKWDPANGPRPKRESKPCGKCGGLERIASNRECRACSAERKREKRRANPLRKPKLTPEERKERKRAYHRIYDANRRGGRRPPR